MLEKQTHPFRMYLPKGALAMIIGLAPPYNLCTNERADLKEGEFAFYYGSINDHLWYVLKAVFAPEELRWPRSRAHCEKFLKDHKLAMMDVLKSFNRLNRKSSESALSELVLNDKLYSTLLNGAHSLRYLYFMGNFAYELFMQGIRDGQINYHIRSVDKQNKSLQITLQKGKRARRYWVFILNTASPRINRDLQALQMEYQQSFKVLTEKLRPKLDEDKENDR